MCSSTAVVVVPPLHKCAAAAMIFSLEIQSDIRLSQKFCYRAEKRFCASTSDQ